MKTVRLRSKVLTLHCTWRPTPYEKYDFDWTDQNNYQCEVPVSWWESVRDGYLDNRIGLKYSQALIPN